MRSRQSPSQSSSSGSQQAHSPALLSGVRFAGNADLVDAMGATAEEDATAQPVMGGPFAHLILNVLPPEEAEALVAEWAPLNPVVGLWAQEHRSRLPSDNAAELNTRPEAAPELWGGAPAPAREAPGPTLAPPAFQAPASEPGPTAEGPAGEVEAQLQQARKAIVSAAHSYIGSLYSWGGNGDQMGSNGMPMFDCSGFVIRVLAEAGVAQLSDTNVAGLKPMFPETAEPEPGDLCFTETRHVTIYIGGGRQIGANGGNSNTHGDNPEARVQPGPDGGDSHGSVEQMIRRAVGLG